MAFPTRGTPIQTIIGTSLTSHAVSVGATVPAGALIEMYVHVRNAGTWTKPSGFTEIPKVGGGVLSIAGGASVGKLDGFYKFADGSEGGTTPTFTASVATTAVWQVIVTTGVDTATAPIGTQANGDVTSANPPSNTPGWTDDTMWTAIAGHSAGSAAAFTAGPSGYSGFVNYGASAGGGAVSLATAYLNNNAASEDPGTFTVANNRYWAAFTVATKPSGGGPPPAVNSGFFFYF